MHQDMDGSLDTFTIVLLAVAVVIFLKLRNVLGRKTGQERPPFEPYQRAGQGSPATAKGQEAPSSLARRAEDKAGAAAATIATAEERIGEVVAAGSSARSGLLAIANADTGFDASQFVSGAKAAYEMIVTEFAAGNRKALKPLLSADVYDGFMAALNDRDGRGEKVETRFVGINRAEIVEAELRNKNAQLTVRFLSQLITATRNRAGEIIDGDPMKVRELSDIWTFARELPSANPNWRLVATQPSS
jgi:predicted lipid-binding transport protein (Tim44 family)